MEDNLCETRTECVLSEETTYITETTEDKSGNKETTEDTIEIMEDNSCEAGTECVPSDSCDFYTTAKVKLNNLSQGSEERKTLLKNLRSLVCNKEEKKICCDNSRPSQGTTIRVRVLKRCSKYLELNRFI